LNTRKIETKGERLERCAKKCRHFNGIQNDNCKAGVAYKSLPERVFKDPFVCFGDVGGCVKYEATGIEEVKKQDEEVSKMFNQAMIARKAIVTHTNGKRGVHGKINCPICNGLETLCFSVDGSNGHIHAACSTKDCVRWME
jgi:hypothetical protein